LYIWAADWRRRDLLGEGRRGDNWTVPRKLGTGRKRRRGKNWKKMLQSYY
jgi:hypothetical protein